MQFAFLLKSQGRVLRWLPKASSASKERRGVFLVKLQERHLLSVLNRVMREVDALAPPCVDIWQVNEYCPGLAIALRTLYTSARHSFGHNARKMKDIVFVDAVHFIYVAYVSMFRADKYMASIITPLAKPHGTEVFSSLEDLVEAVGRATAPTG
jgi:hypothetical protein